MNLCLIIATLFFIYTNSALGKKKPTVTLYYESECSDSKAFVKNQLLEAWTKFKGSILLDLLPYGKAEQLFIRNRWVFECQHYQKECLHNKLHICAIQQLCGIHSTGTKNCTQDKVTLLLDYIHCLFTSNRDQVEATPQCAKGMDPKEIVDCAKSPASDHLFAAYGLRTQLANLDEVPWITIDGKHDPQAEINLMERLEEILGKAPVQGRNLTETFGPK